MSSNAPRFSVEPPLTRPARVFLLTLTTALLAVAAALASFSVHAQPVPTGVLNASADATSFTLTGSLQAQRQSTVAAQVGGSVLALAVKAGDRVKAGQLLVRIDERDTQAGLNSAAAGVAQAEAQASSAELNLERTRELRRQGFISQAALDLAETQARAARAGLEQARAGRSQAALARSFAGSVAPFDAVVLATHVEAGDLASPGRPLVTLYAPGRLRAVVEVPASRSVQARSATTLGVQLPDGRWVAPVARAELPSADPVSQTVEWRLDLAPELAASLTPGQAVQVRFEGARAAGAAPRPMLPRAAVLQRGELSAVYGVQDGRFVLRPVRLGAIQGDEVELLAGLKPGDRFALDAVRAGLAQATPAEVKTP
jgi:RND family efflux transporter MFP subunit